MKRIISFLAISAIVFVTSIRTANAQNDIGKGNFLFNVGFGLGGYYYAGGIPFMASAEWGLGENFSLGPFVSYTSWNYGYFGYDYRYTFIDLGVKGSYHFNDLFEIKNDKVDIYGGAFLGFLMSSVSGDNLSGYNDAYGGGVRLGIHAGTRYYFSDKFAGYAELGYGMAPLSLGVTFKIK